MTSSQLKYLNVIYMLSEKGSVRITDISNYMGFSKVSACRAVEKLVAENLVYKDEKKRMFLTETGREYFIKYKKSAEFLAEKLVDMLGCSRGSAKTDALNMVCAMSEANLDKIFKLRDNAKEAELCR